MYKFIFLGFVCLLFACETHSSENPNETETPKTPPKPILIKDTIDTKKSPQQELISASPEKPNVTPPTNANIKSTPTSPQPQLPLSERMVEAGLVNLKTIIPDLKVDLKYSTTDNFMGKDVYEELEDAYLQKEVAEMLAKAQANLQKSHAGYSLIVYDAARPFSVQQKMWQVVKGTNNAHYVAPPDAKGSMHNYGCAVDLSVLDANGKPLDMGTPFDYFGEAAHTYTENALLKAGKITQAQLDNRLILRKAMNEAGFTVLKREWWHFNAFPDAVVLSRYKKIK